MTRGALALLVLALACSDPKLVPSDAGAEGAAPPRPASGGAVRIESGVFNLQEKLYARSALTAAFTKARDPACVAVTSGACTTLTCPAAAAPPSLNAGTITIDGLVGGTATLAGPAYAPEVTATQRFLGGETITARAGGAEVPAFERSVVAPPFLTLTAPSWAPASTLVIARGKDLSLAWDGGGGSAVAFVALTSPGVTVQCEAPAKSAVLVVPSTALAALPADVGIRFGAVARALGVAGEHRADLEVVALAGRGGALADGPARIE
jgi:hypothetical protein